MNPRNACSLLATCTVAFALGLSAFACSGGGDSSTNGRDPGDPGPGGGFVSDDPSGAGAAPGGPGTGTGGAGGAGGTGGNGGSSGSGNAGSGGGAGDPNRAIEEADIIQVDADRLYALSRYGGLSVIDAARPEQLRMLGRYRTEATPFEMYVKNNVVMGLFNEWGKYVSGAEGWQWVQSSRIAALDTSDPANIDSLGEFTVAGMISDSRIVGNILYVVSRQDGYCYECPANQPRTVILSLDVSNPSAVKKVDELVYDDVNDQWGWGTRSITVTDKRMYVGGREWGGDTGGGSTIQVIDISNPNGDMVPGAKVEAEGQIASRWQMDEYEGTLRVLSQPWQGFSEPPVLQTYRVESAQSVVPLARMPLVLPRPEQLQSTRFDGTRAYAITFQRTDPLFTIDLTNPASPRQMGELEMPGFVYHMEPRGDRLYGLGFDQNNPEGALNVSVFDVSNLAAPKLLDRVNFGSNWGYLPEDQDRIHKAFRLLDQQGMIVVPFSGYTYSSSSYGCGSYTSGVQLVDFTRDDLVLRGRAPSFGQARRAFVHRDRLFTVSDDRVQSFDIANRDAPAALHQVSLARQVNTTAVAGGQLVRLGAEWYTNKAQIDVTPLDNADAPNGIGSLDLESILGKSCGSGFHGARVLGNGNRVYVVYEDYVYESPTPQKTAIAVIDVSNPGSPRLEAHAPINSAVYYGWGGWGYNSVISSGEQLVQLGSTLVFVHGTPTYSERGYVVHDASLVVVDLSQPKSPRTTRLPLPNAQGLTGLHVDGSTILTSHFEPVAGSQGRVRFYVDRIDVSNPATPRLAGKVNVPGSLFAWEPVSRRAITVDYRRTVEQNVTAEACYAKGGYSRVTWQPYNTVNYYPNALGSCGVVHHSLRQVRIEGDSAASEGSWDVPQEYDLGRADVGAERVYIGLNQNYYSGGYVDGCYSGSCSQRSAKLLVLSGLTTGTMQTGTVSLTAEPWGGYIYHLAAFGDRALVAANSASELLVVDASTPTQPKTVRTVDTLGYVSDLQKHGDLAIIASGYDGAQIVDVRK